jgi:hypothetical protein
MRPRPSAANPASAQQMHLEKNVEQLSGKIERAHTWSDSMPCLVVGSRRVVGKRAVVKPQHAGRRRSKGADGTANDDHRRTPGVGRHGDAVVEEGAGNKCGVGLKQGCGPGWLDTLQRRAAWRWHDPMSEARHLRVCAQPRCQCALSRTSQVRFRRCNQGAVDIGSACGSSGAVHSPVLTSFDHG